MSFLLAAATFISTLFSVSLLVFHPLNQKHAHTSKRKSTAGAKGKGKGKEKPNKERKRFEVMFSHLKGMKRKRAEEREKQAEGGEAERGEKGAAADLTAAAATVVDVNRCATNANKSGTVKTKHMAPE